MIPFKPATPFSAKRAKEVIHEFYPYMDSVMRSRIYNLFEWIEEGKPAKVKPEKTNQ